MQHQLRQLQGQIRSQQRQILEQQEALAHLNALIKPQPLHPPTSASLGLQRAPAAATVARPLRPFDAQLAAVGDRRAIGMYDARFHSTNWCAACAGVCSASSARLHWASACKRRPLLAMACLQLGSRLQQCLRRA